MAELLDPDSMPAALASIFATRHTHSELVAGVNDDDCAVLHWRSPLLVVSTDYVNANPISIELGIGDESTIGRLAVAANLSDLLGTGAVPKGILLSVQMSRDADKARFVRLIEGARSEALRWGVPVVGGDTKLGRATAVCGVAIGEAEDESRLFLKYRAKVGDEIWVSGELGSCSAAVIGMTDGGMDASWLAWASDVLTTPSLPVKQSSAVARLGLSCAGTDISDGLGMDLSQLCEASGVGAEIVMEDIPVHEQACRLAGRLGVPWWALAFGVGGEFQFIVTAPSAAAGNMAHAGLRRIGVVTSGSSLIARMTDGRSCPLPRSGHRDGRRLTFAEEVRQLVWGCSDAVR